MNYKAILFDLGGVLINLDYSRTIRAFENLGIQDFNAMYSQMNQTDLFSDFETGRISAQHFVNRLLDYLPTGTSPNKVVQAWNEMILDVPAGHIQLLEKLKEDVPIYMLSNTNELHVPVVRKEWAKVSAEPMERYFNQIYFSHELGLRKPHPETFLEVAKKENLDLASTLFIDDTIIHIEGAIKAGFLVHHLQDIGELQEFFS